MRTRYQQGRDTEYIAQRELLAMGWKSARMAGSKGSADIIAWCKYGLRFIQCKRYTVEEGSYTKDLAQLASLTLPPSASAELWVRQAGQHGWKERILIQHTFYGKMTIPDLDELGRPQEPVSPEKPDPATRQIRREAPWKPASVLSSTARANPTPDRLKARIAAEDLKLFIESHAPTPHPASGMASRRSGPVAASPASSAAPLPPVAKTTDTQSSS